MVSIRIVLAKERASLRTPTYGGISGRPEKVKTKLGEFALVALTDLAIDVVSTLLFTPSKSRVLLASNGRRNIAMSTGIVVVFKELELLPPRNLLRLGRTLEVFPLKFNRVKLGNIVCFHLACFVPVTHIRGPFAQTVLREGSRNKQVPVMVFELTELFNALV